MEENTNKAQGNFAPLVTFQYLEVKQGMVRTRSGRPLPVNYFSSDEGNIKSTSPGFIKEYRMYRS